MSERLLWLSRRFSVLLAKAILQPAPADNLCVGCGALQTLRSEDNYKAW